MDIADIAEQLKLQIRKLERDRIKKQVEMECLSKEINDFEDIMFRIERFLEEG